MSTANAVRAGKAFVELYTDNNRLTTGLKTAEAKVQAFGRKVGEIGKSMMAIGAAMSIPFALAAKTFAGFDDQMRAVKAVTGATGRDFETLTAKARKLGETTSYTAAQVAGAMLELGRAGFAPAEIENAIGSLLNMARATGTELPRAAEIAGNALRQFSLDASETGRVADVLTATANNSAQTMEDLGESLKYAGPIAAEFGMTLEQTSKALGALANYGIKGTMAGTSLRQIMLQIADPAIQQQLAGLGVQVTNANGRLRDLSAILRDLGTAAANMPQADRLSLFDKLFGQRAITAGAKLTADGFDRLNDAIDNAAGTAGRAAAEMDAGLGGALRILWSQIEGAAIAIGEALAPAIKDLAAWIGKTAQATSAWIAENKGTIVTIAQVAAGVLAAGAALYAIAKIVTAVQVAMAIARGAVLAFNAVLWLLSANPVILILGAIAAAIGGIAYLIHRYTGTSTQLAEKAADASAEAEKAIADARAQAEEAAKKDIKTGDARVQQAQSILDLEENIGRARRRWSQYAQTDAERQANRLSEQAAEYDKLLTQRMAMAAAARDEAGYTQAAAERSGLRRDLAARMVTAQNAAAARKQMTRYEALVRDLSKATGEDEALTHYRMQYQKQQDYIAAGQTDRERARRRAELDAQGITDLASYIKHASEGRYSLEDLLPQIGTASRVTYGQNDAAIRNLANQTVQERTAKAGEETAKNTRTIKDHILEMVPIFR